MQYFYTVIEGETRWHLDLDSVEAPINIWECSPVKISEPIRLHVFQDGQPVDFDETSFGIPIVSERLAGIIEGIAPNDVELIPAFVQGNSSRWFAVNVLRKLDCIDHARSKIQYCPETHPERPGKPRGVVKLVLDPGRIGNCHIFRPKDWEVALIISQEMKTVMEITGTTGLEFWPVTEY